MRSARFDFYVERSSSSSAAYHFGADAARLDDAAYLVFRRMTKVYPTLPFLIGVADKQLFADGLVKFDQ
jgi:hypothetical protein